MMKRFGLNSGWFILFAVSFLSIAGVALFIFTFAARSEFSFSPFPSSISRAYPARTVFSPPAVNSGEAVSKKFTSPFVNTPLFQKTNIRKLSYPSFSLSFQMKERQNVSSILSRPLKFTRGGMETLVGGPGGTCHNDGNPNGQIGSNIPSIQCDGLHTGECKTDDACIGTGFCFSIIIDEIPICVDESCLGVCGFDAFIWDPETLMCGCNTGPLVEDKHAEQRCKDLHGEVVTEGGNKFCRFNGDTCPKAWNKYQRWAETSPKTCKGDSYCGIPPSCDTESHNWANASQETCEYATSASRAGMTCVNTIAVCSAPIGEIGCSSATRKCADDGGEEVKDGDTKFCKFSAAVCPLDWSPYGNWSRTSPKTCAGGSSCDIPPSCATKSHSWENNDTQEKCEYVLNGIRNGDTCADTIDTCVAPVTKIGCY